MKHLQTCLLPEKIEKAAIKALLSLCKPVYVRERPDNAV